jgi:hypothetical protein
MEDGSVDVRWGEGRGDLERGRKEAIKGAGRNKETLKEKERIEVEGRKK